MISARNWTFPFCHLLLFVLAPFPGCPPRLSLAGLRFRSHQRCCCRSIIIGRQLAGVVTTPRKLAQAPTHLQWSTAICQVTSAVIGCSVDAGVTAACCDPLGTRKANCDAPINCGRSVGSDQLRVRLQAYVLPHQPLVLNVER